MVNHENADWLTTAWTWQHRADIIAVMSNDFDDGSEPKSQICWQCVSEAFLREVIKKEGQVADCGACESDDEECISLEELSFRIENALEEHFTITPDGPNSMEWTMMREGDYDWERLGQPVGQVICDIAGVSEETADEILEILQERHYDRSLAEMGESGPFDDDVYYDEKSPDEGSFFERWQNFEQHLRTNTRYFSNVAEETLDDVFDGVTEHTQWDGKPAVVTIGPDTENTSLHRARVFQSDGKLAEALERPDLHLAPPPSRLAVSGRMNAHGIAMFYGATHPEIALAEVRPPVGSRVLLGEFNIVRPLRVLNLKTLQMVYKRGSYFDPNYVHDLARTKFLKHVSALFSRPVMPDDRDFEYLITQVVADYLNNRTEPPLDGIMYESSQSGADGLNIALFHKSSRVDEIELPSGTKINANLGHWTDDGWEDYYDVTEEVPAPKEEAETEEEKQDDDEWFEFGWEQDDFTKTSDDRGVTLTVELPSIQVVNISGVSFDKFHMNVRRHRRQADEKLPF